MKTSVIIQAVVEGVHHWSECNLSSVFYLMNTHRHQFYIKCKKQVNKLNREIEIITLKKKIVSYLIATYYDKELGCCNFGGKSCEMLAEELAKHFKLDVCSVLEDNENGAVVEL